MLIARCVYFFSFFLLFAVNAATEWFYGNVKFDSSSSSDDLSTAAIAGTWRVCVSSVRPKRA